MGGNGVKRIVEVGTIAVQQDLSMLTKAPSPIEVTIFDWVVWRVGVKTLRMRSCAICMPYLMEKVVLI